MPYVIDGNNLLYAFKKAGAEVSRDELAALLNKLAQGRQRVSLVFDGPAPRGMEPHVSISPLLEISFSQKRKADDLIMEEIEDNTEPRRLIVVSTDRQIRQAARRRRCQIVLSEEFVSLLLEANEPPPPPRPREPREKFSGLSPEESEKWMKIFGIESPKTEDETDDQTEQP